MAPNWNLKDHLNWIKTEKPYIPKINLDLPAIPHDQLQSFNPARAHTSFVPSRHNMETGPNNSVNTPLQPSTVVPNSTVTGESLMMKRANTVANPLPRSTPRRQTLEKNTVASEREASKGKDAQRARDRHPQSSTRGQVQITQLFHKLTQSRSCAGETSGDGIIDLTQDDPIERKETKPDTFQRKNGDYSVHHHDDTDIFSDEEAVEAVLAEREHSENSNSCKIPEPNKLESTYASKIVAEVTNSNISKPIVNEESSNLLNKAVTSHDLPISNVSNNNLIELCTKQAEIIQSLEKINKFLEKGIRIETSTSLSEDQKRQKRMEFNPALQVMKSECSRLFQSLPQLDLNNVVTTQPNGTSTQEKITDDNSVPKVAVENHVLIGSNIRTNEIASNTTTTDILTEITNKQTNTDIEDIEDINESEIEGDDTDIIIQNSTTTTVKRIEQSILPSSPSQLPNDSFERPKRSVKPPEVPIISSTQEDDIEDSFNCESETEPETRTQIRKEMGDFLVSDEDDDSIDKSYKESEWNTDNEIEEIEEINQSDLSRLNQHVFEEIENSQENFTSIAPIVENISDTDNEGGDNANTVGTEINDGQVNRKEPIFVQDEILDNEMQHRNDLDQQELEWLQNDSNFEEEDEEEVEDDDLMVIGDKEDYFTQLNVERGIVENDTNNIDDDLGEVWDDVEDEEIIRHIDFNPKLHSSEKESHDDVEVLENPNIDEFGKFHGKFEWTSEIYRTLKNVFKLTSFRENQLNAINSTLAGDDVFVLMPTGGGKSLCYQLPAVIKSGHTSGTTIVISPLISLMEDQVQHLEAQGIHAAMLNSKMNTEEKKHVFNLFYSGLLNLLYLSPEMISKSGQCKRVISKLYKEEKFARIVIDEAHCVSSWGHDFRPDYKELKFFKEEYPDIPMMALTATANSEVKDDIIKQLGLKDPKFYKQSFNRTNLFYEIIPKTSSVLENIVQLINCKYANQTGIIYCHSKNSCETTAKRLTEFGISADFYHAGMETSERSKVQKAWQDGSTKIIAATIAFGMGIDKGDVRFVIHLTIPRNLEGYYQETGRAGRDGKHSDCIMYYGTKDVRTLQSLIRKDKDLDRETKEHHLAKFQKVVEYCENKTECRREFVLHYFGESFERKDCRKQCDNCVNFDNIELVHKDMTDLAQKVVKMVKELQSGRLTYTQAQDIVRGAKTAKMVQTGYINSEYHGCGSGYGRGEIERLFFHLIKNGFLQEKSKATRSKFSVNYLHVGPKGTLLLNGREKTVIEFIKKSDDKARSMRNSQNPATLTKQSSFRPSLELWNGGSSNCERTTNKTSSTVFNGSVTDVNVSYKGIDVNTIPLSEEKKLHLNECYLNLRRLRQKLAATLSLSSESSLATDTLLKKLAFSLPDSIDEFRRLGNSTKGKEQYFSRFLPRIRNLRDERMRKFGRIALQDVNDQGTFDNHAIMSISETSQASATTKKTSKYFHSGQHGNSSQNKGKRKLSHKGSNGGNKRQKSSQGNRSTSRKTASLHSMAMRF